MIFQELADHLPRQAENYLTQTLLVVFNSCVTFRREFLSAFPRCVNPLLYQEARMSAQVAFCTRDGRGRLDAKITVRKRSILAIEIKLTAALGEGQLSRYRDHLARYDCPLIVLDAHGSFDELPKIQRRHANDVMSWSHVAQLARAARLLSRIKEERFILEDWMRFLENSGFISARPLDARDWRVLERLASLVSGRGSSEWRLDNLPESLASATAAALRLERHRDDVLTQFNPTWKPFSGMFRYAAGDRLTSDYSVQFEAGMWRVAAERRKKYLYYGSMFLELQFLPEPCLRLVFHRNFKRLHPEYGDDTDQVLFTWTSRQTRRLFQMEFEDAHAEMKPVLLKCVRKSMASHQWKDLSGRNESPRATTF